MSNEARGLGETAHLLDQSGFADARLAAHVDDLTGPPTETRAKDTLELLQLGLAADERAAGCSQGFTREAAQSPGAGGRFKAFQLDFAERIAHAPSGESAVNAIGEQGLSRAGSGHKARGESSLNRRVPCSRSRRRVPKCRRPLHHWRCRHGPEAAGWRLRSSGRVPHGCPMRHGRRASDRRHAHGAHRKAPSRRRQCACRPCRHIRRRCRRRGRYSGRPARGPLPDRAFATSR